MRTIVSKAYRQLLEHTGNPEQLFYAQRMTMREGRADQLEMIDVDNGSGLHFHILPGKGMDIGRLSFRGMNVSFLSKAGYSNAAFYEPEGMNGIHTFDPGFLTTCGLRNSGLPCETDGETFGFHGRIGQTPVDAIAKRHEKDRDRFGPPEAGRPECCCYYRQARNEKGESFAACVSPGAGFGVMICTDPRELPLLCNWHSRAAGDYVMGIEPCTCYGDGRKAHMERNQMTYLAPYETMSRHLVVKFVEHEPFKNLIKTGV